MSKLALERHLQPLMPHLMADGVTEICINRPKELFVEQHGIFTSHKVPELEYPLLQTLAALVAEYTHKDYPTSLVAGKLPCGARIQFVLPPATESENIVCSIRRQQKKKMSLADFQAAGAFSHLSTENHETSIEERLAELYRQRDHLSFIQLAIKARKNILICGGTGTGKTTFLNACLQDIPSDERLITVEDTRELIVEQPNAVHLLFNESDPEISSLNIFKACLRLRPDRIFLSELRGNEVWPYLRAANSGHPGSLSTVHADTPEGAFKQLVFMMQQAGSNSSEEQIYDYVKSIIHVVVQLKRERNTGRFMHIEEVWYGAVAQA